MIRNEQAICRRHTCFPRMSCVARAVALACLFAAGSAAIAAPIDCLLQPNQVVQLGAATPGVLEAIDVDRGAVVRRGQVVARLAADVERANLQLVQNKASQTGDVQAAERSREFARRELTRTNRLIAENFVSKAAADKAETESQVSDDRLLQAVVADLRLGFGLVGSGLRDKIFGDQAIGADQFAAGEFAAAFGSLHIAGLTGFVLDELQVGTLDIGGQTRDHLATSHNCAAIHINCLEYTWRGSTELHHLIRLQQTVDWLGVGGSSCGEQACERYGACHATHAEQTR